MARSQLVTGAKVILYINGNPYAMVTSFRWDSATPKRAIYGLDSATPYELAPGQTKITGSIGLVRLSGDGGLEGAGIVAPAPQAIREKYFTIQLVDRSTDTQLFAADKCSVLNQGWEVGAKGLMSGNMSFEALAWNNESKSA